MTVYDPEVKYSVTFLDGYGGVVGTYELAVGEPLTVPEDPVREGYEFNGWNPEIPPIMPGEDLTFTAIWAVHKVIENEDGSVTEVTEEVKTEGGKEVKVETATSVSEDGSIVSETVVIDDGGKKDAKQNVSVGTGTLTPDVLDKALKQAEAERENLSDQDVDVETTVSLDAPGGDPVTISPEVASGLKVAGADLSVKAPEATVSFDGDALDVLSGAGSDVELDVSADVSDLSEKAAEVIGNNSFVNISVTSGGKKISNLDGGVKVSMPYTPSGGNAPAVYAVDEHGNKSLVESSYEDGALVFTADGFSAYVVEESVEPEPEPETGSEHTILTIAAVGIGLIAIAGVAYLLIRRRV